MKLFNKNIAIACAAMLGLIAAGNLPAKAQRLPNLVRPPAGLNIGNTSFFDGFGARSPGFTFVNYGRINSFNRSNGNEGRLNSAFTNPSLISASELFQLVYRSPITLGPGALGFNLIVPLVSLDARFQPPGIVLRDNGVGFGDITVGPTYQSDPIIRDGRPVFSWRAAFDVRIPIGTFNRNVDLNQGTGYWSVVPYVALSYLPTEKFEISGRLNYLYNFETSLIANSPPIPGVTFRNGQAGDLGWINFAGSYAVTDQLRIGLNGYYLRQFSRDRTNGIEIQATQQENLYAGPGARITIDEKNFLNLNLYLPVYVRNGLSGPQVNYQYVHRF